MPSLIPGFEYDIFISYRQKDNKHDGWVTEFVDNLNGELESTFKEEISVYFDINPHDGLLETHDVDASLKEKLKCLIFIPIISQTYCDSKSFAWQHEFVAFNKIAKEDLFGRDIRLKGGNVASRILPIKIHDLDTEDNALLENELGGVLRSIEFIYKSAGVNRPLTPSDNPDKNLNKTYYRDQINKVSNAIKEIFTAIKKYNQQDEKVTKEDVNAKPEKQENLKVKIILGAFLGLALIVLGYFFIPELFKSSEPVEKSIAVLPFKNDSNDSENQHIIDGTMEAILDNLCKIADLKVISRTSVEQYRNTSKSILKIAKELNANYILEGSGQKNGDDIRITVQLIDGVNDKHIWSHPYDKIINDIFKVQSEIAQSIASEIKAIITPEEKKLIEKIPTYNLKAYDKYLIANDYQQEYTKTHNLIFYQKAVSFYKSALDIDSTFAKAYTGLASAYYTRYYWENYYKQNFLDSCLVLAKRALAFDDQLDEAYYIKGQYYRQNGHFDEALNNFNTALKLNPNYFQAYYDKGNLLRKVSNDYVNILEMFHKALNLIGGEDRPTLLRFVGLAYAEVGFFEEANKYVLEALDHDRDTALYKRALAYIDFCNENFEEALKLVKEAEKIDTASLSDQYFYCVLSGHDEEAYLHARKLVEYFKKTGELDVRNSFRNGYAFYKMGKYKEAENFFNRQIEYSEESIKLDRYDAQSKQSQLSLAFTYAFKGDKVKAYHYLDELNTLNFYSKQRIILIKNDLMGASINKEEQFQKILKNMETKYQAEHERVRKWLDEQGML